MGTPKAKANPVEKKTNVNKTISSVAPIDAIGRMISREIAIKTNPIKKGKRF
jgi:hypothetical protein